MPQVFKPAAVQKCIEEKHNIRKRSYDKSNKPLKLLLQGQVVRLQTTLGHSRLGFVVGPCQGTPLLPCQRRWCPAQMEPPKLAACKRTPSTTSGADPFAPPLLFNPSAAATITSPSMSRSLPRPAIPSNNNTTSPACSPYRSPIASPAAFSLLGSLPPSPTNSSDTWGEGLVRTRSGLISRPPDNGEYV